jgi:hypothetical protein
VKRPYREGDWFAVPLGDGRCVAGIVTRGTRKAIFGSFFGPARNAIPAIEGLGNLRPENALWSGRFSDRAIVEERWPVIGRRAGFVRAEWAAGAALPAALPATVERRLAALTNGATFETPRLSVRALRSPVDPHALESLHQTAILQWREPPSAVDLARLESTIALQPGFTVRLQGRAAACVNDLAIRPLATTLDLEAGALPELLETFPQVTELRLDGVPADLRRTLHAFPALRTLRIRARGARVDASALEGAPELEHFELRDALVARALRLGEIASLRSLDIEDAALDDAIRLPQLQALRLARIASFKNVDNLRDHPAMRALALVGLMEIDDLSPIASIAHLESLELRGLWQFGVGDLAFVASMPSLRRLFVDIGGRRKNAEIYRQRAYAAPLPFIARSRW